MMHELEHCRETFCGVYTLRDDPAVLRAHFANDPGFTPEEQIGLVNGLRSVTLNINSNYEFHLTDHSGKKIRYHLSITHNGFWFTHFACQSMATFENYNLTIQMLPKIETARKISYKFYQDSYSWKGITLVIFNGRTSCTVNYKKTE